MPSYTHFRRAQPVLVAHFFLSHAAALRRDADRLAAAADEADALTLGSGAIAGTSYPVDTDLLARALGFSRVVLNSMDASSDRDFAASFLYATALAMVHLSRLAEDLIIFTGEEHGFFELADASATGSSMMPQKKNPDPLELVRGKTGRVVGCLTGWLVTMKGLPTGYNKDLQEDKEAVFDAESTLALSLRAVACGGVPADDQRGTRGPRRLGPAARHRRRRLPRVARDAVSPGARSRWRHGATAAVRRARFQRPDHGGMARRERDVRRGRAARGDAARLGPGTQNTAVDQSRGGAARARRVPRVGGIKQKAYKSTTQSPTSINGPTNRGVAERFKGGFSASPRLRGLWDLPWDLGSWELEFLLNFPDTQHVFLARSIALGAPRAESRGESHLTESAPGEFMQQRRVRLGDILDDYCPRERRITNHAVVAMIDDTVKQTRCTTCDADHEYRGGKAPTLRRRKAGAGDGVLVDARPRRVPANAAESELDPADDAIDAPEAEPAPLELSESAPEPAEPDAVPETPAETEPDVWVHRPLIRATLPRPEGQSPERKATDFTVRPAGGRFDSHRNGQGKGGHRPTRHAQGQPSGQGRFGGPRTGSGQGPRHGAGQGQGHGQGPGQRPANRQGPGGGSDRTGQNRGPRQGGGGGRKRGR